MRMRASRRVGLVVLLGVGVLCAYLTWSKPVTPGVTLENARRIRPGMTYAEVRELMGCPPWIPSDEDAERLPPGVETDRVWMGDGVGVLVVLDGDGRVTGKDVRGGPPPTWFDRLRQRLGI